MSSDPTDVPEGPAPSEPDGAEPAVRDDADAPYDEGDDPSADLLGTQNSLPAVAIDFFKGLPAWMNVAGGVVATGLLLAAVVMLYVGLGDFLVVLFLSVITAYLLDPVIDRFEAAGWNRSLAILTTVGSFLLIVGLSVVLIVPYVVHEIGQLTGQFDTYFSRAADWVTEAQVWVAEKTGNPELQALGLSDLIRRLPALVRDVAPGALDPVKTGMGWALGSTTRALGAVVQWSLFPVFVFFFLRDFDGMKSYLFELLPFRVRRSVLEHYTQIDQKIAAFIRGQVLVAVILAALYSTGLVVFTDIDLALLIGVLAGLLFVVPYLGTILGITLGTLMAVLKFGVSFEVLKVWLVFGVVQGLEGAVLTPKIVGDSVGLHPVTVMVSLLVGASLFGILGMLMAVPVAASLAVVGTTAVRWYKKTSWFQEGSEDAPTGDDLL
ncbi:MAG: AI-2E family transporter [Deltaproteobacteria bacterium]|nr:AI-2E family transporter [Deltaproteobacteria bacterium]